MSASNAGTAKSGLPMKITRMARRIASGAGAVKMRVSELRSRLYAPRASLFRLGIFKTPRSCERDCRQERFRFARLLRRHGFFGSRLPCLLLAFSRARTHGVVAGARVRS